MRELLVSEAYGGGLMGHFGVRKTLDVLHELFFFAKDKTDVERVCARCVTCRKAKSRVLPYGLYSPLPIPSAPRVDILWILWLLIGFLRWHNSYLVIKPMMQPTSLIYSLNRYYGSMVFLGVL